jgi:transposase
MNPLEARKLLKKTSKQTKSIRKTAEIWKTSRNVVRKWVRRFKAEGKKGLRDRSRRPLHSPRQTQPEIEKLIILACQATGYGRDRLSIYLSCYHDLVSRSSFLLKKHLSLEEGVMITRNLEKMGLSISPTPSAIYSAAMALLKRGIPTDSS